MSAPRDTRVYLTLDGLRGVAAIAVVLFHWGLANHVAAFRSAYLAVDFFFLLSGFVLAKAYDARFAGGLTPAGFMRLRIMRLYPLVFLSAVLAVGLRVALRGHAGSAGPLEPFVVQSLSHFALIPVRIDSQPSLFQWNIPMWSLFFELVANAVFGVAWALTSGRLRALVLVSGAALAVAIMMDRTADLGSVWPSAGGGLLRVVFSFFAGVALYRCKPTIAVPQAAAILTPLALVYVLAVTPAQPLQMIRDVVCVLALFPLLLVVAANVEPRPWAASAFRRLGVASYGVYVLHFPVLAAVQIAIAALHLHSATLVATLELGALAALVPAVWVLDRWYDAPVRAFLSKALAPVAPKPRAVPQQISL